MREDERLCFSAVGVEPGGPAPGGPPSSGPPLRGAKRPLRARRRVAVLIRRMGIWLDAWGLRGYPQDTHDWSSKVERLRSMKTTSRQIR